MNYKQQQAVDAILKGHNCFITGQAGTGKSHIIKHILSLFSDYEFVMKNGSKKIGVTATTGAAAVLIDGCTIHSWAGVQQGNEPTAKLLNYVKSNYRAKQRWKQYHILIIDEVSMLNFKLFESLNEIGQAIRGNTKPFGGIQVVLFGDMAQLRAVKCDTFIFETDIWKEVIHLTIYLTENMRQKDAEFQQMLSEIRLGICTEQTESLLNECLGRSMKNEFGIVPTKLYSTNANVDRVNTEDLARIPGPRITYTSKYLMTKPGFMKLSDDDIKSYYERIDTDCSMPREITLVKGAQVMLTRNISTELGLCNGSRGVVTSTESKNITFSKSELEKVANNPDYAPTPTEIVVPYPTVRFLNGCEMVMEPVTWERTYGEKIKITKYMVPLKLGFAATIHKSQGLTLDYVLADCGPTIFEAGQAYVLLSRVRSLSSLSLINFEPKKIFADPKVIAYYNLLQKG